MMATPRGGSQVTNKSRTGQMSSAEPKMKGSLGSASEYGSSVTLNSTATSARHVETTQLDDVTEEREDTTDSSELPFFKQDQFTDVVLQVGGKKLFTCRALLAYNSPVLAKILSSGTSKNKDLDLPEKEYEDVVELLAYIDPRVDFIITEQSAIALLPLAEEYEISGLKNLCEESIVSSFKNLRRGKKPGAIPVDITIEYLLLADKYDFPGLRKVVTDEFVKNEDPNATKTLLESSLISERIKLSVLDRKVEKVHFELDKERRERTAIETKLGDYGNKRFRRPIRD